MLGCDGCVVGDRKIYWPLLLHRFMDTAQKLVVLHTFNDMKKNKTLFMCRYYREPRTDRIFSSSPLTLHRRRRRKEKTRRKKNIPTNVPVSPRMIATCFPGWWIVFVCPDFGRQMISCLTVVRMDGAVHATLVTASPFVSTYFMQPCSWHSQISNSSSFSSSVVHILYPFPNIPCRYRSYRDVALERSKSRTVYSDCLPLVQSFSCTTAMSKTSALALPFVCPPMNSPRGLKLPGSTKPTHSHSSPRTS